MQAIHAPQTVEQETTASSSSSDSAATQALCEELETLNATIRFLLFLVAGTFLSYYTLQIERKSICLTLQGKTEEAAALPELYPLQISTNALAVGSLGFFFCLTLKRCAEAANATDPVEQHSAAMNVVAGFLVLLAALIRLYDINFVQRCQSALTEELLPD